MNADQRFEQSNLTYGQQLMWVGQKLNPLVPLYNMNFMFTIHGEIDTNAFQQAFLTLLNASDNLRTVIQEFDTVPQPVVVDVIDNPIEIIDFSEQINPEATLETWVDQRRARLLDLEEALFDCVLIKLAEDKYAWYFGQHHIATDAKSVAIIYNRVSDLYQQIIANGTATLSEVPDYSAYKEQEDFALESEAYQKAQSYWEKQLNRSTEPLQFYSKAQQQGSSRTERIPVNMGDERQATLADLSTRKGFRSFSPDLTYSNIFGALIIAYMYRISQNDTIRIGTPFANRSTPAFEVTQGLFIEVLSLTVDITAQDSFADLVKKVASANFGALQHLQPAIGTAEHNRAYDVLMNFVTVQFSDFAGLPTETAWVHSGFGDSNHKIRIQIHDFDDTGKYDFFFDFNTGIFSPPDYDLAIEHFLRVVDGCIHHPDLPIAEIDLLSETEREGNLVAFNATDAATPQETVIDLFEAQVASTPNAVAVSMGNETLTYSQLNGYANALATRLQAHGIGSQTLIPVCLNHSIEMIIAVLGILKAGGAYVPIDPNYPDERIAFILDDIGQPTMLITEKAFQHRFEQFSGSLIIMDDLNLSETANLQVKISPNQLAYVIYTSGSTGKPKGVLVQHDGLTNYILWAQQQYIDETAKDFALFSSLAFDLTVTSIYVPLISGGSVRVYQETNARGMVIRDIFADDAVDIIKLTPSHLALVRDMDLSNTRISKLIVGGENFKTSLAQAIHQSSNGRIKQFNEYGPTEATVACLLHQYQPMHDTRASVPIGTPADNMRVYILDDHMQPTATGIVGELYLSGIGVARGYLNRDNLTTERFLTDTLDSSRRMYKTGDLARWLPDGQIEFLGRADRQVKVGGVRLELGEIEATLLSHPAISAVAVDVRQPKFDVEANNEATLAYCTRCGIASDFPGITFDDDGVCSICRTYDGYKDKALAYFKDMDDLKAIVDDIKANSTGEYDCVALMSGGKDSSYMVYRLVQMGLKVLTFTLDNGYISDEAKANVRRITASLGVDHVFGETPFMNSIFVDSLQRYANVCNGCFKTIYTLATNIAREKGISTIVTGLSRGQFFETRLTEEVFARDDFNIQAIDASIERARKAYHQRDDIISRSLDVDVFRSEALYENIRFVDFYRYCDVDLSEIYDFLDNFAPWIRPSDTGRSTNCLINDVGIYVHQKRRGFHSYALPYSWDVRMGHKTRDEAMEELDDSIDENRVKRIMKEIGYHDLVDTATGDERLVAYYVADKDLTTTELRDFLAEQLPEFLVPSYFVALSDMPLSTNGKVKYSALPDIDESRTSVTTAYMPPETDFQATLADIWQAVMNIEQIGIHDNFFDLGGHSLPAIRISSRINEQFEMDLSLDVFFANPTIASLAEAIEEILIAEIDNLSDEEILRLLEDEADE